MKIINFHTDWYDNQGVKKNETIKTLKKHVKWGRQVRRPK